MLLDVLTPIAKAWPSQWCLAANDLAIQVHGGYGYAREYLVEQFYRDNRLNAIHEGTNGIQALDLLGRKVAMEGGAGFKILLETIEETLLRAQGAGPERAELAAMLRGVVDRLADVTDQLLMEPDSEVRLANATVFLEVVGHVVVAWLWLEQVEAAEPGVSAFYEGKRQAARFFYLHELPRVGPQLDLLARLDRTVLEMRDEWF
jgi:butyryl-CoA dehydrogenase